MTEVKDDLGVREASELLGVSEYVVREEAKKGNLGATKEGNRWVFSRAKVLAHLDNREEPDAQGSERAVDPQCHRCRGRYPLGDWEQVNDNGEVLRCPNCGSVSIRKYMLESSLA